MGSKNPNTKPDTDRKDNLGNRQDLQGSDEDNRNTRKDVQGDRQEDLNRRQEGQSKPQEGGRNQNR